LRNLLGLGFSSRSNFDTSYPDLDPRAFLDRLQKQRYVASTMLSGRPREAAVPELQSWANQVVERIDPAVAVTVEFDGDSNTFLIRLAKGARVLIFRLSQGQVHTDGREAECERTLNRKIKDLWNLI